MTNNDKAVLTLPDDIAGLLDMASDLSWSWNRDARALFRGINPLLWRATLHNPCELLYRVDAARLEELAGDPDFVAQYRKIRDELHRTKSQEDTWFAGAFADHINAPVAYFCAEFGLHNSMPIYSGGLGILAGDHCKAAADLGVPLVGVGLMYTKGYFDQRLRLDGWQEDTEERFEHAHTPLEQLRGDDGGLSLATVQIAERTLHVGAWRVQVGCVPVILLDTNLESNDPADRELSQRLYRGGEEHRLRQEWVLGTAGVRVLRTLGYEPAAWHSNEGHAGFMLLERLREYLGQGIDFDTAVEWVRRRSVFTTHTPVAAGHDMFTPDLITHALGPVWEEIGIDKDRFLEIGHHPENNGKFHMTAMAIRLSRGINGVSERHGSVSRNMWRCMWPDSDDSEIPIGHVTNGVHLPSWMSYHIKELFDRHLGLDWETRLDDPTLWDGVLEIDDGELWRAHTDLKGMLIDFVHETARRRWRDHWTEAPQLVGAGTLLSNGPLTIGFARRFATYKRADLLFRDLERLRALITDQTRPVQIIFAGKAHPADDPGKHVLQRVFGYAQDSSLEGRVAFLEDYEMHMARRLVQGVDLWLNLPRVPMEACGTSGMKAALNGVPQLGTSDGWWAEGHTGENGWRLPVAPEEDPDAPDAEQLYSLLEQKIVPLYYNRNANGIPVGWTRVMKHAIAEAGKRFTARRMVKDYTHKYYMPAIRDNVHAPAST
jgi:starch phosphorylase